MSEILKWVAFGLLYIAVVGGGAWIAHHAGNRLDAQDAAREAARRQADLSSGW